MTYAAYRLFGLQSTILSAAAFFVANTLFIATVIALTEEKNVWQVWRDSYFWTFPNYLVGAAAAWVVAVAERLAGWQAGLLLMPIFYVVYRSHSLYVGRLEEAKKRAEDQRAHAEEVAALHRRTIETLAIAIEAKDQTTHDHLARVETYAVEVAKDLGFSETELEALRAAALLHDVGKIAVPEYIISKPGKLTPEEFERMKTHTVVGAELVERIRFPYSVAPMVRGHHEKWNGSRLSRRIERRGDSHRRAHPGRGGYAGCARFGPAVPARAAARSGDSGDISRSPEKVSIRAWWRCWRGVTWNWRRMASGAIRMRTAFDGYQDRTRRCAGGRIREQRGRTQDAIWPTSSRSACRGGRVRPRDGEAWDVALRAVLRARESWFANCGRGLLRSIPYDALAVYRRQGESLFPEFTDGEAFLDFLSVEIPVGQGLSGWVAENGKAIINGNPAVEPGYLRDPSKSLALGLGAGGSADP